MVVYIVIETIDERENKGDGEKEKKIKHKDDMGNWKSTNNECQPTATESASRTRRLMDRRGCAGIIFYKMIYKLTIMANKCNYVIISIRRLDEARLRSSV